MTVDQYKREIGTPEYENNKIYLGGIVEGVEELNSDIVQTENENAVFCEPDNHALTVSQAEDIMLRNSPAQLLCLMVW